MRRKRWIPACAAMTKAEGQRVSVGATLAVALVSGAVTRHHIQHYEINVDFERGKKCDTETRA